MTTTSTFSLNRSLLNLPSPSNISLNWNMGSLLGMILSLQIMTGLFLSMHYSPDINIAFNSIIHITRDVSYGWLLRALHANGASLFFIFLFLHMGRGLYYNSFFLKMTWFLGIVIFILSMLTAFLGYVLPWGQMSYWGATVITNLLSTIPYINKPLMLWVWGSFSIDNPTLNRLYSLHFIFPFMIAATALAHLTFLHSTGSSNPLGSNSNMDKIPFHPYFSLKDSLTVILALSALASVSFFFPSFLSDPENFLTANPMTTPAHIQPEWYFLFAYAILRSIPNKLGGVCTLSAAIMILTFLPLTHNSKSHKPNSSLNNLIFWLFVANFITLSWIGAKPIEDPFTLISQFTTLSYFILLFIFPL